MGDPIDPVVVLRQDPGVDGRQFPGVDRGLVHVGVVGPHGDLADGVAELADIDRVIGLNDVGGLGEDAVHSIGDVRQRPVGVGQVMVEAEVNEMVDPFVDLTDDLVVELIEQVEQSDLVDRVEQAEVDEVVSLMVFFVGSADRGVDRLDPIVDRLDAMNDLLNIALDDLLGELVKGLSVGRRDAAVDVGVNEMLEQPGELPGGHGGHFFGGVGRGGAVAMGHDDPVELIDQFGDFDDVKLEAVDDLFFDEVVDLAGGDRFVHDERPFRCCSGGL